MIKMSVPYLCGGVVYFLIAQTKAKKCSAREHADGVKDSHADPIVMADLIYAVTGTVGYEASKDASKYRECVNSGSVNVPFNEKTVSDNYDDEVKNKYSVTLGRMTEFVKWHIASNKTEWLTKAILEIIEEDENIPETDVFYVQPNGSPVSKTEIRGMTDFVLPALLVGTMHYIENNRRETNELGVETLEAYGTKSPRRERTYNGNLGAKITRRIVVERSYSFHEENETECAISDDECENTAHESRDAHTIIEEKIIASAKAMADAWKSAVDSLADEIDGKAATPAQTKRINEDVLSDKDKMLLEKFREHTEELFRYCIDNDPSAGPTRISLADELHEICHEWNFEVRKIRDAAFRQLVIDTIKTLDEYSYYLTDKFLRWIPDTQTLWFRNESWEEGEQLRNVLQPESYRLRCEIGRLYERMYPIPEDEGIEQIEAEVVDDKSSGAAIKTKDVVHQTIVNQYGDHPIHIDHVENLKL